MSELKKPAWLMMLDIEEAHGEIIARDVAKRYIKKKRAVDHPEGRRPIPRGWVEKAFLRQKGRCARCGDPMMLADATGDHTVALAQGGLHKARNIKAMCARCNSSKGANSLSKEAKLTGRTVVEQLE